MWSKLCRNLRTHEHDEHSCRRYPSRPKSTTRAFDRGDVFVEAQPVQLAAVSSSRGATARGLALCPRYHPAWVSVGTPVGPGKDTHGTLGPDQRERP